MSSPRTLGASSSSSMALVDQMSVTAGTQDAEGGHEDVYDEDHEGHYESQAEGRDQSSEGCQDELREYPEEEDHDGEHYEDQGQDEGTGLNTSWIYLFLLFCKKNVWIDFQEGNSIIPHRGG